MSRAGSFLSRSKTAANATICAVLATPATYLSVLTALGWPRPPSQLGRGAPRTRFAIYVPAHDEEASIERTITSLRSLDYPAERFSLHLVADNCSDSTAAIALGRGVDVHERTDPTRPGKGPALNWLHARVTAVESFDVVVVVDADTVVDPGFLRAMDAAFTAGARVAQGHYTVLEPEASPMASFRYAALACRHHLRPLGRRRLGASCGLYGNGMAFRRELLDRHRWTGHLVEDAELQMELLLDGTMVTYVPDAVVRAEMPDDAASATSQQRRWERGRIEVARTYVPRLARQLCAPRAPRIALVDAIADHVVPPLSVLAAAQAGVGVVAGSLRLAGIRRASAVAATALVASLALGVHVVAGLARVGASRDHVRQLVGAPAIVIWKIRIWLGVLGRDRPVQWRRTERKLGSASS